MSYTVADLIAELSQYPGNKEVRFREYAECSEVHYELDIPDIEEETENGVEFVVIC